MVSNDDRKKEMKGQLNNLMRGLEGIVDLVGDLMEKGENLKNISGEIELPLQRKLKAKYDMSVKLGLDDIKPPDSETIIRKQPAETEPDVEVYDEEKVYRIIVLTKNVGQEDIKIYKKDGAIIFEARNPEVLCSKEIEVPYIFDDQQLTWTYKNGVIEIAVRKEV